MQLDLCATEARLLQERQMLQSVEQAIEWDRVCCQLGVRGESEAALQEREAKLRNLRIQWQARDTAAQRVRVRLEEEQALRAVLPFQQAALRAVPEERTSRLGDAIRAFFARCRNADLELDAKSAAPALRFTPRRTSAEKPPSSFVLTVAIASDGQVLAADEQGAYRHFNLLQDHPSEWFVR